MKLLVGIALAAICIAQMVKAADPVAPQVPNIADVLMSKGVQVNKADVCEQKLLIKAQDLLQNSANNAVNCKGEQAEQCLDGIVTNFKTSVSSLQTDAQQHCPRYQTTLAPIFSQIDEILKQDTIIKKIAALLGITLKQ